MRKTIAAVIIFLTMWSPAMADILYGRENMAAFFAAVVKARTDGSPIRIHLVGDSKVEGHGVSTAYRLDKLMQEAAQGYPVQVTYDAWPGQNSYTWTTKAADFVANHPNVDLLIVDIGTNERVSSATGGPQTIEQTKANHLSAIATIRASRPASSLSILLLGQTPGNNWQPDYQQTTEVMQEVNGALKEAAIATNSAYFDTLELFQRAHSEAGWMEQLPTPTYGDGNVHPGNSLNFVLIGELSQKLFPPLLKGKSPMNKPTLLSGWKPWYDMAGYAPRAVLDGDEVSLDGLVQPGTGAVVTGNYPYFQLPPGYWPPMNRFFLVPTSNGGGTAVVWVMTDGLVKAGGNFTGTYISFDGIRFRIN